MNAPQRPPDGATGGAKGGPASFLPDDEAALSRLRPIVSRVVRNPRWGLAVHDREDLVQDAMTAIWKVLSRTEREEIRDLERLAVSIAIRRCITELRRKRLKVRDSLPDVPDGAPSQEGKAISAEHLRIALAAFDKLSPECRDLMEMRALEGLSFPEIAQRKGSNENALRQRMFQCLQRAMVIEPRLRELRRGTRAHRTRIP